MSVLDKDTRGPLVKLIIFIVATTMATGVLVVLIGNITFQSSHDYKAVFTDATGVNKGDDIRIAGVKVGSVKKVEVVDRTDALVSFNVAKSSIVTKSSTATIRYRNLVGQRYISLTQGVGDLDQMPVGLHHPALADPARSRPHGAVQRLQAAVRRAVPGRHQQAVGRGDLGLPGRGRQLQRAAPEHRVADQHPGRPRQGHRRDDRQPQRRAEDALRARQAAEQR